MKYFVVILLFLQMLYAGPISVYETSLYSGVLFLFLLLLTILTVQMRKSAKNKKLLEERDEKITWLRQIHAENMQTHLQKEQEMEKEILKLTHANENLELRLKEGTKNQVVNKIEELQSKRQAVQSRHTSAY